MKHKQVGKNEFNTIDGKHFAFWTIVVVTKSLVLDSADLFIRSNFSEIVIN